MRLPGWVARALAAGTLGTVLVVASVVPATANFNTVAGYSSRDLAVVGDGHRLKANVVRADGAVIVAEDASPYGDGYLHLVHGPGELIGPANRFGAQLQIGALVLDGGLLYGLSTQDDQLQQGACPLYVVDAGTGAARVLRYWRQCSSEIVVDPLNNDLVLQDGALSSTQPGPIVELDPATGATTGTLVQAPPSDTVEGMAFDMTGSTLFLGNSQSLASGTIPTPDGIYAYSRQGAQLYPAVLTDASPDGMTFGGQGTCFAGALVFSTDPGSGQSAAGNVYLLPHPGAGSRPQLIASAPNPDLSLLWMSAGAGGDPVVSHNGQVTELQCQAAAPPPPPPPPAAVAQPQPPAQPQPAARPPQTGNSVVADPATRGAALVAPPGPPGPAVQAATVQAAQPAAQGAVQGAPAAGLLDALEEDHAFSVAAAGLPLIPGGAWMRLALGGLAVSAMALSALWLIPDPAAVRPRHAWSRR